MSVYVPAGYNIVEIINQLFQEKGTASNIKSKSTRKNVLDALETIINELRLVKQTPPNGLVVFCGNVSPVEGKTDLKIWTFEPVEKMSTKVYWCDQVFVLEPLKELIAEKELYGLIVLDAKEANIGLLSGKKIEQLKHLDSTVPSKSVKGGMCVSEDTHVSLVDGTNVPIRKLKMNDKILSFNFKNSSLVEGICSEVFSRKLKKAYEIVLDNTNLIVSPEHLIFVDDADTKEKNVEELKVGDKLFVIKNGVVDKSEIKEIKEISCDNTFFDISVYSTQNFVTNGIVVHNSQRRYDRIREDALNEFFTKVGEAASEQFLKIPNLKGIIIGGPGPTKEDFYKKEYLNYQVQAKVLGVKDIGYTGEYGLEELVKRSEDLMKEAKVAKERELLEKFFTELQKSGKIVYGQDNVRRAVDVGAVEILLVSETLEEDLIDDIVEKAKKMGASVELISVDTTEGKQFRELGGIGAFLRYKLN